MAGTQSNKFLVVIVGPTAVGKTDMAVSVARRLETEIISADSRQFYSELNIGTAKPNERQMQGIKHHFVGHISIFDPYDAGKFSADGRQILSEIWKDRNAAVLVGGSGLYINAVVDGLDDLPPSDSLVRKELNHFVKDSGIEPLLQELALSDPVYFEQVDRHNPVRIIRAIEVIRISGQPYSSFRKGKTSLQRDFNTIKVGLNLPREVLYARIDQRMDDMIRNGLFEEAEKLYPHAGLNSLQTVGYSEIFGFLKGKYDQKEAIRLLKRNSRRYAKRQLTWFNRDPSIEWFEPDQYKDIMTYIRTELDT